jgi:serine phosphatase RsbU (regulator of sigma subunit)
VSGEDTCHGGDLLNSLIGKWNLKFSYIAIQNFQEGFMTVETRQQNKKNKLGNYIYPARIAGYLLAIICLILFQVHHPKYHFTSWGLNVFCLILLLYPHLGYWYYRQQGFQRKVEFRVLIADMFLIAWINFFLGFSPAYGLLFFISNSATNYATGGFKLFRNGLLAFALGFALSFPLHPNFYLDFNLWVGIPSFIYLLLATHYIGFISYSKGSTLQKVKLILEENNQKLEQQQKEIEEKNKDLLIAQKDVEEGLSYAYGIQKAILPPDAEIKRIFQEYMVLFRPRDIISGDFYWLFETETKVKILIVADCTGHGVPGAFMGLIGQTFLNEVIIEKKIYKPNEILEVLHQKISSFLRQKSNSNQDGMDVSIIAFDAPNNILTFAAAKQSLIIITKNTSQIKKGSLLGIGGEQYKTKFTFENQDIPLKETTRLYLFSDGIADQFGGLDKKKLGKSGLKQKLINMQDLPIEAQSNALESFLEKWMKEGNEVQIDDVIVFGIELHPTSSHS